MRPARPSAGAQPRPCRASLARHSFAIVLIAIILWPAVVQAQYSTTGRWTAPSASLDSAGSARTALHMSIMRGDDDWRTEPTHYHSYILWWESRHALCNASHAFNGALYGWNPPNDPTMADSAMHAGFTPLPLGDGALDPGFDVFCSGQTFLKDGRLFTIGGASAEHSGTAMTAIFDRTRTGNRWVAQGQMAVPRWYPTAKQLANNDVVAFSGLKYARLHTVGGLSAGTGAPALEVSQAADHR